MSTNGLAARGSSPLIGKVRGLGMEFGLWFEPEMINLDSDLARAHPEWIFRAGGRKGIPSRQQYVLDLGHPGAYNYIADRIHDILDAYDIDYLKWDHNRMVVEAGHGPRRPSRGACPHLAVYRLLDELRERHPGLEIESCAGGGGRIDLGILERTDRVWASDCIDALERQQIQRYTQLLFPPELVGSHVGAHEAHTTRRDAQSGFPRRHCLLGSHGDRMGPDQGLPGRSRPAARLGQAHKQYRDLLHTGDVVVADHPDPAVWVHGVVATDRSDAIFGIETVARSTTWPPGRVRLPGLDPIGAITSHPCRRRP